MGLMKELSDLNNIYHGMYEVDEAMVVTAADKKANTPAYQNYKKGLKNKKGEPVYKAADHLKDEVEILKGLIESGKLSEDEVKNILWNQIEVEEGYQRNPEEGERKERESAKKREAIPGQARRGMPPRGDKKREEFERWYAANVR